MTSERWVKLPCDGPFEGVASIYWVSTEGNVVWVAPNAREGKRFGVKSLRLERRPGKAPHYRTNLKLEKCAKYKTFRVHTIVAHAFDIPGVGSLIRHLDGDSLNNRPSNLRWGTDSENLQDAWDHGARGRADYDDSGATYQAAEPF